MHAIVLESSDPDGPPNTGLFGGALDVEVRNPYGKIIFQRHVEGREIDHAVPSGRVRTGLGLFDVPDSGQDVWALTARVTRGDSRFGKAQSSVYIAPPPRPDTGLRVFGLVLGAGGLAIFGAALAGAGVWLARR